MIDRELRTAIQKSGLSANLLAQKSGVSQTVVSRFLRGHDLGLHRAALLAKVLRLELRPKD